MFRIGSCVLIATTIGCDSGEPAASDTAEPDVGCVEQAPSDALSWEEDVALESAFLYARVDEPQALVLAFHGGGGDMVDPFARVDPALITREALARGMAVASLNSYAHLDPDSTSLQWDERDYGSNRDLAEAEEMIHKLVTALGVASPDTPIVLLGMSNGGSMASRVAQSPGLDAAAAMIYISNAQAFHEDGAKRPPMVLVPGAQDPGLAVTTNTDLADEIGDPDRALLIVNPPEPVADDLLTRIPGIDCDLSIAIKQDLIAGGFLDLDGTVLQDPKSDTEWLGLLPADAVAHQVGIREVLLEAYAGHAPSSDQNARVFDFVVSHL
jgi:predicted esterase